MFLVWDLHVALPLRFDPVTLQRLPRLRTDLISATSQPKERLGGRA